jgi:hypothetical protein
MAFMGGCENWCYDFASAGGILQQILQTATSTKRNVWGIWVKGLKIELLKTMQNSLTNSDLESLNWLRSANEHYNNNHH